MDQLSIVDREFKWDVTKYTVKKMKIFLRKN